MGNPASGLFIRQKLSAIKEIIDFTLGFEEDNDWSFFSVYFLNVVYYSCIQLQTVYFFKLD